jgi:hypothetical protein
VIATCQGRGCCNLLKPSRRARPRKWCSDECRKRTLYAGTCIDCGASTNGSDGPGKASERCQSCRTAYDKAQAKWTRERIIQAIQQWATVYGAPPAATDWNVAHARALGLHDRVARYQATDRAVDHPAHSTVQDVFGSWSAATVAAGFTPNRAGRPLPDAEKCREVAERYMAGEGTHALAREYGVRPGTVRDWAQRGGATIRPAYAQQAVAA